MVLQVLDGFGRKGSGMVLQVLDGFGRKGSGMVLQVLDGFGIRFNMVQPVTFMITCTWIIMDHH